MCDKTQEQMIDYLGPAQLLMYFDHARFNQQEFNAASIKYESKILNRQFDYKKPNFFHSKVTELQLQDESNWIDLGIAR